MPTPTPTGLLYVYAALDDERAGLRYRQPLGPPVPALNAPGLGYVRDDLLARAASAEAQSDKAWHDGNKGLGHRCDGIASACREAARQIVTYALDPHWQATEVDQ